MNKINIEEIVITILDIHTFTSMLIKKAHKDNDENMHEAFGLLSMMITCLVSELDVSSVTLSKCINKHLKDMTNAASGNDVNIIEETRKKIINAEA